MLTQVDLQNNDIITENKRAAAFLTDKYAGFRLMLQTVKPY